MKLFIEKPQMALALNLLLVLAGIISFFNLPVRHEPNVLHKSVAVETRYPGAQVTTIEDEITEPIEEALTTVDGVKNIFSESKDGNSHITVKMEDDANYEKVVASVKDIVGGVISYLPKDAEKPRVYEKSKRDNIIAYLTVDPDKSSMSEAYEISKNTFKKQLLMLDGVAKVDVWGEGERYISISVSPISLAQYNLSLSDIVTALKKEKVFASGGSIKTDAGVKTIVIDSPLNAIDDIREIPVKVKDGTTIKVDDIADVTVANYYEEFENIVDGKKKVILAIVPKLAANPIQVVDIIKDWMSNINQQGQQDYSLEIVVDKTVPLKENIRSVAKSVLEAIIIVALVVTFSLRSLKLAFIPNLVVMMCLISSFFIVFMFGLTINPIVLLAFVVSVGLIVDDSIVVIESIYRRVELGENLMDATRNSLREISFAVVVMTISIAAVYVPLAFQTGKNATIFKEFAWTLSGSVIVSGIMALTLVPAIVNKFNIKLKSESGVFWGKVSDFYEVVLRKIIGGFYKIVALLIIIVAATAHFYSKLPFETKPPEEDGIIFGNVLSKNPIHNGLKEEWKSQIAVILEKDPMVKNYLVQIFQPNFIQWVAVLPPRGDRDESDNEVGERIKQYLEREIVGPKAQFFMRNNSDSNSTTVDLEIFYNEMTPELVDSLERCIDLLESSSVTESVSSSELERKFRYIVEVDRPLLSKLGINIEDLEKQLFTYFQGVKTFNIRSGDSKFEVIVSGGKEENKDIDSLNSFFVYDSGGSPIPLGSLVEIKEKYSAEVISHTNNRRVVNIEIALKSDVNFYDGVQKIKELVAKSDIHGVSWGLSGKYTVLQENKKSMYMTFGLCIVFVFLIFAILFNSFIEPLLVLFTVPVSIFGAVAFVYFWGGTNNFYFQIACITLVGLISKHGVFIVDTANRNLSSSGDVLGSILSASKQRLRPILMTTIAMIAGSIPLLFNLGTDYIGQRHIAWVMIGGLITGTLFSLFVVPVFYYKAKSLIKH